MLSLTQEATAKSPHTDIEPIQAVASFQSSSQVGALAPLPQRPRWSSPIRDGCWLGADDLCLWLEDSRGPMSCW